MGHLFLPQEGRVARSTQVSLVGDWGNRRVSEAFHGLEEGQARRVAMVVVLGI